jgi:hypothetical protein
MQRSKFGHVMAVALTAVTATVLFPEGSAAQSSRYERLPEVRAAETIIVTDTGGSTWFKGTDDRGQRVMVTFLPRFATVERDGRRVPVSRLRAGDRVEVRGRARGHRIAAASAQVTETRTASVRQEPRQEPTR